MGGQSALSKKKKKKYNKFQQAENTALFQRILNLPYEERSAGMN